MATKQEYTIGANVLVNLINTKIGTLSSFQQSIIREYLTPDMINAGAGAGSQAVIDAVDAFRAEKQAHAASYHAAMKRGAKS